MYNIKKINGLCRGSSFDQCVFVGAGRRVKGEMFGEQKETRRV